jgi:hypothetical protein
MKKVYLVILYVFFSLSVFSQSFPYLNASSGNQGEFPVDQDTNVYMYHGSRLAKVDKNLTTIWANTYSGLSFQNILLSKTGSIYFIARQGSFSRYFGKMNSNGTVVWVKNMQSVPAVKSGSATVTYTADCRMLFLDREGNLIVTGEASVTESYLLKLDTNGNTIKFKLFAGMYSYLDNFSILADSSGHYKIFGLGLKQLGGHSFGLITYSDITDVITQVNEFSLNPNYYNFRWQLVKSRFSNYFYVRTHAQIVGNPNVLANDLIKLTTSGMQKWSVGLDMAILGSYRFSEYAEETHEGDLFYSMSNSNSGTTYNSGFVKVDSSGVANNFGTLMLNGYFVYNFMTNNYDIPAHAPRSIHAGNYYFDISGYNFPSNPLTVQKFNSSLSYSCASNIVATSGSLTPFTSPVNTPTLLTITSSTIPAYNAVSAAVGFSVNTNYCLVMNANDLKEAADQIEVYPNPGVNTINIVTGENRSVLFVEMYDVSGRKIKNLQKEGAIDVSDLSTGVYFLVVKTEAGTFRKKFVKQ